MKLNKTRKSKRDRLTGCTQSTQSYILTSSGFWKMDNSGFSVESRETKTKTIELFIHRTPSPQLVWKKYTSTMKYKIMRFYFQATNKLYEEGGILSGALLYVFVLFRLLMTIIEWTSFRHVRSRISRHNAADGGYQDSQSTQLSDSRHSSIVAVVLKDWYDSLVW